MYIYIYIILMNEPSIFSPKKLAERSVKAMGAGSIET